MNATTRVNTSHRNRRPFTGVVIAALLLAAGPALRAEDNDAKAIIKAMSDSVSSQQTIELTFDSDIEVITPQLEKIQFSNSGDALLARPDKLRAHRASGHADVELFYDGSELTLNVRDDGRGPPAGDFDTLADGRMGLAGMRERALALGGSVELEAHEQTGTLLRIRIPVTDLDHNSRSDRGGNTGEFDQQEPIR